MHDLIFYTKHADSPRIALMQDRYPYCKIIHYNTSLSHTAVNARKMVLTKWFWLIDIEYEFLDAMLSFEPKKWDTQFTHVFKLNQIYDKKYQCYLLNQTTLTDTNLEFFPNLKYINSYNTAEDKTYDIFFISYNEPNSWKNWNILVNRFPHAVRILGESNIFNSHRTAATLSTTDYFFVVDGDNEILDSFDFSYYVNDYDFDQVHIWHSRNEINDLEYGNGAVKLFPKIVFDTAVEGVDISTSLSDDIKIIEEVVSINRFASSPYNAWRSAFRECAKLASASIDNSAETTLRLSTWTSKGLDRKFGEYTIPGAIAGMNYGLANKNNQGALVLINNWPWLYTQFQSNIKLPYRPE